MIDYLRYPQRFVSKAGLALDVVLWLFWLPVLLRIRSIPVLLKRIARSEKHTLEMALELRGTIEFVTRICNLRPFQSRLFPKQCLRQSLSLYRTLIRRGYPVEIHFGVLKNDRTFHGHSWVTLQGEAVADTAPRGIFKVVYSYPSGGSRATDRYQEQGHG